MKYYEESIKYMADISNTLKVISGAVEKPDEPENVHVLDEITTYNGALNLQGYTKVVKRQWYKSIGTISFNIYSSNDFNQNGS